MPLAIPVELYEKLAEKLGKETALEVVKVFEEAQKQLEDKVVEETKKRKIELRDELRKELATKEDILLVRQEIETVRQELKGEIEALRQEVKGEIKVLKMWIIILGILMVALNQNSLELLIRIIFGNIK
ncbi:hypothetical protein [Sulfurihydrogenibium azorense]|uniref:hypothetical protein n=1 Tax=Sulfurihydrogenibium azorense TaxID=309806 RepID=UPI00391A1C3E